MVEVGRLRIVIVSGLFIATVVSCFYPIDEQPEAALHVARQVRTPSAPLPVPIAAPVLSDRVDVDPFALRDWQPEQVSMPLPTVAPEPEPVMGPVEPPAPPALPPLPFQYIGRLNDGTSPVVYLSHGDQTLIARTGETLEQTYKVISMSALQIEFQHLPTGDTQLMSLPDSGK